jgi:hypothetical protein
MMSRRSKSGRAKRTRFSAQRVGLLTAEACLVLAGFIVVLQASIGGAFRFERPQLTLAWMPYDAEARARIAAQLAAVPNSPKAQQAAINLARNAVERDPIMPIALRALAAVQGDSHASQDRALALIQESQRLSRRDQLTQIWLIRHYVENGEFAQVIPHVDIALRSSQSVQQTLFPLLMSALEDDRLFNPLLDRLREKPDWRMSFIAYFAANSPDLERATSFSLALLDPHESKEREVLDRLLQRLVAADKYELAWNTYARLGVDRQEAGRMGQLIDGGFDGVESASPFGWVMANTPDLFAGIARDPRGSGNVLTMMVNSGHSGEAVRQLLRLPSGAYRLHAELGDVPEDSFERPELRIKCADETRVRILASVKPASGGSAIQTVEQQFSVPVGCDFQWFSVAIAGGDTVNSETPWIDNIELSRVTG